LIEELGELAVDVAKHHPMDPPDPIEAIRFRVEQQGTAARILS